MALVQGGLVLVTDPEPESTVSETYEIIRGLLLLRPLYMRHEILFRVTVFLIVTNCKLCYYRV